MTKKKTTYCIIAIFITFIVACIAYSPFSILKAKANSWELFKTNIHYLINYDQEKSEATRFILSNIDNHYCYSSKAIEDFTSTIRNSDSIIKEPQLNKIWGNIPAKERKVRHWDIQNIKSETLISDIDFAFDSWRRSPWKSEVSFQHFCSYILPYRVMNEKVESGWRAYLYKKYKSIIANTTKLQKAFYLVHDSIQRKIKRGKYDYPYQMNAFELENIQKGSCLQRCIYEVAVMRALGIPAVIDGIDCWSNYSKNGHTWVALVAVDGTYTVADGDSVARKYNPIDSSIFKLKKKVSDDFPCDTTFKKRCAKILRYHFDRIPQHYDDQEAPKEIIDRFTDVSIEDVSKEYGFKNNFILPATESEYCYLCVYRIEKGWYPIAYAQKENAKYSFHHIGDSCIYLPVIYKDKKLIPLSNPIKIIGSMNHAINPSKNMTHSITIDRKYPLVNNFFTEWARLEGGKFVGFKGKGLKDSTILWTIDKTPLYINKYKPKHKGMWQRIKFQAPEGIQAPFAEITFTYKQQKINAIPYSNDSENIDKCMDGNYFTMSTFRREGYLVMFNLQTPSKIDQITLVTKNDGNFVIPGHTYTLSYYDMEWKTIKSQKAKAHNITFDHVPIGALLLLKDDTEGIENRPFLIQSGKQEWW